MRRKLTVVLLLCGTVWGKCATCPRDGRGRIKRSAAVARQFQREHPCPSTGKRTGACPGFVKDHIKPLECGGPDSISNLQWQTVADGKAKDRTEKFFCR